MTTISKSNFKIFFMFLLFITFAGTFILYRSNYAQSSRLWLGEITKQFHSVYWSISITKLNHTTTQIPLSQTNQITTKPAMIRNQTTTAKQNSSGLFYHNAYPRNYYFIIDEPDKCQHEDTFLILMVPVAPHQLEARNAIRSTWGNESMVQGKRISLVFILGLSKDATHEQQEQLKNESLVHHDLIQANFTDTYRNLTIKTMLIIGWLAESCSQATYAMKVDSDMFLNPENLMNLLTAPETPRENYITGMIMWNRPVVRNINSKWYVSKEDYPNESYPTYLLGMGYVFSMDLPKKLVESSKDVKPFPIEDAYIGACLAKLGISPSKPRDPSQFRAYHSGGFDLKLFSRVITTILGNPKQLIDYWHQLKQIHNNNTVTE